MYFSFLYTQYHTLNHAALKHFPCLSFRHRSNNLLSASWGDPYWTRPALFTRSASVEEAYVFAFLFLCQNTLAGFTDHHLLCGGW